MYSMVTKKEGKREREEERKEGGREEGGKREGGRKKERKKERANLPFFSFLAFLGFSSKSPPKQTPLVLEKKTESAVFQVCGENVKSVEKVFFWIQDLIQKEQCPYTSEDECIKNFDVKEYQELNELQKKLNISISLDRERPLIEVSGITKDVIQVRNAIEDMIKRVRLSKEQEYLADRTSDFVEWQYKDDNKFHSFDKITNMQLEDAKKQKRKTIDVKINHQSYTVDLETYIATDANGKSLPVGRRTKPEGESNYHACCPLLYACDVCCTYIKMLFK